MITFYDNEFNTNINLIYDQMCEAAKHMTYLHVKTVKWNNPYHFEFFIEKTNKAIESLKEFYHRSDSRRDYFKFLNKEELIKEVKDFLNRDLD